MPRRLRPAPGFRPINLALTPAEIAAGLCHLPGFAFFDSSGNLSGDQPLSIIGARPESVLSGTIDDVAELRAELQGREVDRPDCGFPLGAACGSISYNGAFRFGFYENLLVYAHAGQQWFEVGSLLDELQPLSVPAVQVETAWQSNFSREGFIAAVDAAQEYIARGDIYQVNLSQQFRTTLSEEGSLFAVYDRLRAVSPAPMAAYLHTPEREILSSSPETFLRMHGRAIETRPIKGTRPRFADPELDSRSAFELQTSEKEIAELVMITDLERNDLGRVCEFGSVAVTEMLKHERLEQVHHLVSTVTGQLREGADQLDALQACFPGGSITGAPKKRAMEIIAELENVPRGLYTGAMGYLGFNGESQFNIAIRTLVREGQTLSYGVGAGIVADSIPEMEYEETLQKATGLRMAFGGER
ncbi:MAG: aminodeoxychorismate synthase component I [Roseibacillus sp.]|nr:aminodeoxychorismate synthase component I [Roseibacillus sp.]